MNTVRNNPRLSDGLLEAAFAPEGISSYVRLETHEEVLQEIGWTLLHNWEDADFITPQGLRLAVNFACAPSTEHVIRSQTHSHSIAEKVDANLTELSKHILSTPSLTEENVWERRNSNNIRGAISELAILGTLWRGIVQGHYDDSSYVLPTTAVQDASTIEVGYYTGADLIMRKSGVKKRQLIQVKNNITSYERYEPYRVYRPDIAMLTPQTLLNDSSANAYALLQALAEDDIRILDLANQNASEAFEKSQSHSAASRNRIRAAMA